MDAVRRAIAWKLAGGLVLALVSAAVFAAYLKPDLLVSVWTSILLCF